MSDIRKCAPFDSFVLFFVFVFGRKFVVFLFFVYFSAEKNPHSVVLFFGRNRKKIIFGRPLMKSTAVSWIDGETPLLSIKLIN